jgi:hypothetical protein
VHVALPIRGEFLSFARQWGGGGGELEREREREGEGERETDRERETERKVCCAERKGR